MELKIYGADFCNPCKQAKKYLDRIGVQYTYIDLKENPKAGIRSVPTFILETDGVEHGRLVGFDPTQLNQFISNLD